MVQTDFTLPETLPRKGSPVAERWRPWQRVQTACLIILTVIAVGFALKFLEPLLVPFLLALFFTYCLLPIIDLQMRYLRMPRWLAILGASLVGLVIVTCVVYFVVMSLNRVSQNFDAYEGHWNQLMDRLFETLPLDRFGVKRDPETGQFFTIPENASRQVVMSVLSGLTYLVSNSTLVVVFMVFIFVGRKANPPTSGLLSDIQTRIKRYLVRLVFVSALAGALVGLTLYVLHVEFAFLFGFLAFALHFIPTIGSIIATVLPLPVILVSDDLSLTAKILALVIPGIIQFVIGNIMHPKIQGTALALHPVTILAALIFFGMIWGVVGAFLAMPIAGVTKIVLERFASTHPVAALLEGDLATVSRSLEAAVE
jgi:AI-2 transport protein TqsA